MGYHVARVILKLAAIFPEWVYGRTTVMDLSLMYIIVRSLRRRNQLLTFMNFYYTISLMEGMNENEHDYNQ